MKVISIANIKGGVGKTSATIEIASILKDLGNRVLVIDLDENSSLSKSMGVNVEEQRSIYEVFHATIGVYDSIQHLDAFDIIPASKALSLVPAENANNDDVKYLLDDLIQEFLKDKYDFVFIDNAPSRSLFLKMTLIAADYLIIPTLNDENSTDMIIETERDVAQLVNSRNHDSHAVVIGYILSRYKACNMSKAALARMNLIAETHEKKPFVKVVSEGVTISEVKTYRTSNHIENQNNPSSKTQKIEVEYQDIVKEILKRIEV